MLGKLIKYDLKKISKTVFIYFIVMLIFSIITRIMGNFTETFIGKLFYGILRGCAISCFVGILINAAMGIWGRFRHNIYKDESYLTHTLPVEKSTIYNAKEISAIIVVLCTIVLIVLCAGIVFLNKDTIEFIKNLFKDKDTTFIVIGFIITAIFELLYAIQCGIVGLLIGHQSNNKKGLRSIVIGIVLYYMVQTLLLVLIYVVGMFSPDVKVLFSTNPDLNNIPAGMKELMIISNCMYFIFIAGLYIAGKKIINKGVNVE